MDKPCPNNTCDHKYKVKKKPLKCPSCDAHIGKFTMQNLIDVILLCGVIIQESSRFNFAAQIFEKLKFDCNTIGKIARRITGAKSFYFLASLYQTRKFFNIYIILQHVL